MLHQCKADGMKNSQRTIGIHAFYETTGPPRRRGQAGGAVFAFQQATPDDADAIATIVIAANGELVEQLFGGLIPKLDSAAILSAVFIKGEGPYTTANVICSRDGERMTGMLFAYPASEHVVPLLLESFIPAKRLRPVRPILEKSVPDSLYVNTMWLEESARGKGQAAALVLEMESLCRAKGLTKASLFCWNDNDDTMRFWAQHGFSITEHIALPLIGEHDKGGSLLCKSIGGA